MEGLCKYSSATLQVTLTHILGWEVPWREWFVESVGLFTQLLWLSKKVIRWIVID